MIFQTCLCFLRVLNYRVNWNRAMWESELVHCHKKKKLRRLRSSSYVSDLITMDCKLTDKIGSSLVLTSENLHENVLVEKTSQKLSGRANFPCSLSESGQEKRIALK